MERQRIDKDKKSFHSKALFLVLLCVNFLIFKSTKNTFVKRLQNIWLMLKKVLIFATSKQRNVHRSL